MNVVAISRLFAHHTCSRGFEIRGVWRAKHEMDIVAGSVFPDKHRAVRTEVVQHDDQPLSRVRSLELLQHLTDIFLFGVLPEGDDRGAIDHKNARGIGSDLRGILHQRGARKRPHALGISCRLRRTLIQEPKHHVLAHPRVDGNPADRFFQGACQTTSGSAGPDPDRS